MPRRYRIEIFLRDQIETEEMSRLRKLVAVPKITASRIFVLEDTGAGEIADTQIQNLAVTLLADTVRENFAINRPCPFPGPYALVARKWGVNDPVLNCLQEQIQGRKLPLRAVSRGTRFTFPDCNADPAEVIKAIFKTSANPVVDQVTWNSEAPLDTPVPPTYRFALVTVPLTTLGDRELEELSRRRTLSLSLLEMNTIADHYRRTGREPTDLELETLAQTWSEHCKHKTFSSPIQMGTRRIGHLLKETIMAATKELAPEWCVSVFHDNAGVVAFDGEWGVCFKVETHNHPSALEPYGGAGTGTGGVVRDILGTGLGAKPIANTDVFCLAPPDLAPSQLPPGVIAPKRLLAGVVAGVRDYGNCMGIPTVNGALYFDPGYAATPLVFCGTVGLLPLSRVTKKALPGDAVILIGGRTGRDGLHGATFSSAILTNRSEDESMGSVQIGDPFVERKVREAGLKLRDAGLLHCVTDCGAGGLSSAVGEMASDLGAEIHLERVPLKYPGLSYREIWLSEAQERMVLAAGQESLAAVAELCRREQVECTVLGTFTGDRRLRVLYQGQQVGDLDTGFLHDGVPRPPLTALEPAPAVEVLSSPLPKNKARAWLAEALAHWNVCSREWVIHQYDHEVLGGTVLKPLHTEREGPSDGAVIRPLPDSDRGLALACGLAPRLGRHDPFLMAVAAVDETLRNLVACGGQPDRAALLDNFAWGNPGTPAVLGALVRAAEGAAHAARIFRTPFISGKDSLFNEYHYTGGGLGVPPTLLISGVAPVPEIRRIRGIDLKEPGNPLYLAGATAADLGGSLLHDLLGEKGGRLPRLDEKHAPRLLQRLHEGSRQGLWASLHDCSDGGIAVTVTEMALASPFGASLDPRPLLASTPGLDEISWIFSESLTRFVVEVPAESAGKAASLMQGLPFARIGIVSGREMLEVLDRGGQPFLRAPVAVLAAPWRERLRKEMDA